MATNYGCRVPTSEPSGAAALEREVLVPRYLYYVLCCPAVSDFEYDIIERQARAVCPPESPVHGIGSGLAQSYPPEIRCLAESMV